MRWRSKRRGDRDAGGHVTSDGPPAPSSTVPGNGDQGWSALPPIASTWSPRTPLTATPTTPITALRPPLTQETHRASAAAAEGAPDPGRVVGLAAVARPRRPEPAPHVPEE